MHTEIPALLPAPRYRPVVRTTEFEATLDSLVPQDDQVRTIEDFTQHLDFSALDDKVEAREGLPGAPAYNPRMLFAICLFATICGHYSFRKMNDLCKFDLRFRWLCGGLEVSYHTLSTFFSENSQFLRESLVDMLVSLKEQNLVTYEEITIDGRKIPANAGKQSMHGAETLEKNLQEAQERVDLLTLQRDEKGGELSKAEVAKLRGAEDRLQRLQEAKIMLAERTRQREEGRGNPAATRVSETDPECRKMKLASGEFAPALNVQTVTETEAGLIIAVKVIDQASDNGQALPMVREAEKMTGTKSKSGLLDSGYSSENDVQTLEEEGFETFMPPKNEKKEQREGKDPYARKRRDTDEIARWRARMGTVEGKQRYKQRGYIAEGTHARQKNRGFRCFRLRGILKAQAECFWQALAHNFCILCKRNWINGGEICPEMK